MGFVDTAISNIDAIGVGRKGTINNPFILKAPFWTVDTLFWCIPNSSYDFKYTYYLLSQINFLKYNEGSTLPSLSSSTIYNIPTRTHTIEIQKKIGEFLSLIDDLIEDSDALIKNITIYKDYLISQLITNSKDIDEEIKSISDILYIPPKEEAHSTDTTKILRLGLHTKGLTILSDDNSLLAGGTKYYHRKAGDFIFGKQNIFNGSVGIIPGEYNDYLSSGDVPTLRFKNTNESDFFLHFISRKKFYNDLEIFANGSGSKRVHEKDLLNIKIKYPNNRENITKILNNMDSLIKLHNIENESYRDFKKYYLNLIFK